MKLLAIGDVVGRAGTEYLLKNLRRERRELGADLVIVNGENAAGVRGLSPDDAADLFDAGADVITTGNHAFGQRSVYTLLDDEKRLLRPDNFPGTAPGHGSVTVNAAGLRVLVLNLQGNVSMAQTVGDPFAAADALLRREAGKYDLAVLDFHAEATSEKIALALWLDGRVSAFFGTHTHVATADEKILPRGTGYVTDLGMTGPENGVLGVDAQTIIAQFRTALPQKYTVADGACRSTGALFDLSADGKCRSVRRVSF